MDPADHRLAGQKPPSLLLRAIHPSQLTHQYSQNPHLGPHPHSIHLQALSHAAHPQDLEITQNHALNHQIMNSQQQQQQQQQQQAHVHGHPHSQHPAMYDTIDMNPDIYDTLNGMGMEVHHSTNNTTHSSHQDAPSPQRLMQGQMAKYGNHAFQKDAMGNFYTCFFQGCGKKLQANFSRHIHKHEQEGTPVDHAILEHLKTVQGPNSYLTQKADGSNSNHDIVNNLNMGSSGDSVLTHNEQVGVSLSNSVSSDTGTTARSCSNQLHFNWWGTDPQLPASEFYNRSNKCKRCYIKQQQERKRNKSQTESENSLTPQQTQLADGTVVTMPPTVSPAKKRSRKKPKSEDNSSGSGLQNAGMQQNIDALDTAAIDAASATLTAASNQNNSNNNNNNNNNNGKIRAPVPSHEEEQDYHNRTVEQDLGYVDAQFAGYLGTSAQHVVATCRVQGFIDGAGLLTEIRIGNRVYHGFALNESPSQETRELLTATNKYSLEEIEKLAEIGNWLIRDDFQRAANISNLSNLSNVSTHHNMMHHNNSSVQNSHMSGSHNTQTSTTMPSNMHYLSDHHGHF